MGSVHVTIWVGNPAKPSEAVSCEVLADTGATLTILPGSLLEQLGLRPEKTLEFVLADGRELRRPVGEARVAVNGDAVTARVVFGEPGDAALLGLAVLEELGLAVDPVNRRLVPAKFLLY